MGQPMEVRVLS